MNEPTQEEIKKFWIKCGFKKLPEGRTSYHFERGIKTMNWLRSDGEDTPRLPSIDLSNLFRYAVPKLLERYDIKIFSFCDTLNNKKNFWFVHALNRESGEAEFANIVGCEKLEDALFQVCQEVLNEQ